jgi:hypothetical protein
MNATDRSLNKSRRRANNRSSMRSLDATRRQRPPGLPGRLQFLAEPDHRAIEMMQFQLVDAVGAVIVAPIFASAIRARHHEAVQHGQEHRALDRELKPAPDQQFLNHGAAAAVAPQPLEQHGGANAPASHVRHPAALDQRQNHRTPRQPRGRPREAIEIAAGFDRLLASEIADDALFGLAVLPNGLDQIQITVGADSLLADEHAFSSHGRSAESIQALGRK